MIYPILYKLTMTYKQGDDVMVRQDTLLDVDIAPELVCSTVESTKHFIWYAWLDSRILQHEEPIVVYSLISAEEMLKGVPRDQVAVYCPN